MRFVLADIPLDRLYEAMVAAAGLDVWSSATRVLINTSGQHIGRTGINPLGGLSDIEIYRWLSNTSSGISSSAHIAFHEEHEDLAIELALRFGSGVRRADSAH